MNAHASMDAFDMTLTPAEHRILDGLTSPMKIQNFLDTLEYSANAFYRCPIRVIREKKAHCFDGAIFAAMSLHRIGFPPLIMEMLPNDRDDDHLLAVFRLNEHWGAVAKSNFVGLRFREPVYRTLRELVMSYFESYYNIEGEKTLRGYTAPLNLNRFDHTKWMTEDKPLELISDGLDAQQRWNILKPDMVDQLNILDERSKKAGLLYVNKAGLYRPE
jgi:hypothetical protein